MAIPIPEITQDVRKQFSHTPEISHAFDLLLRTLPATQADYITVPMLLEIGSGRIDGKEWLILINHLVGERYALFQRHIQLLRDDEEDGVVELEPEDYLDAERKGYLEDPETGKKYRDFRARVILYFSGTKRYAELSSSGGENER